MLRFMGSQRVGHDSGVVTFTSHPDSLVSGTTPQLINTTEDRRTLLQTYGIEKIVELPFNRELMQMPWQDFICMLRETPYHAAGFVCGSDFRFGFKGEGTAKTLARYCDAAGMPCAIVPQQEIDGIRVSSTYIRGLIQEGQVEKAATFLGHPHFITGTVVKGRGLGHTIGIPTANLALPPEIVCPRYGVYACRVSLEGNTYAAVTNVGTRPTVGGENVTVEPWILDFDGDLYGKEITLQFLAFLRPEQKFGSLEDLKTQIQTDAESTRLFFK